MKRPMALVFVYLLVTMFVLLPMSFSNFPQKESEFIYARIRFHLNEMGYGVHELPWHQDHPFNGQIKSRRVTASFISVSNSFLELEGL